MALSGLFSKACSVATWNGRVVLVEDTIVFNKKVQIVKTAADPHSHTLVQEIGGTEAGVRDFAGQFQSSHFAGWSLGEGSARGGFSLHKKKFFCHVTNFSAEALVPGRAFINF